MFTTLAAGLVAFTFSNKILQLELREMEEIRRYEAQLKEKKQTAEKREKLFWRIFKGSQFGPQRPLYLFEITAELSRCFAEANRTYKEPTRRIPPRVEKDNGVDPEKMEQLSGPRDSTITSFKDETRKIPGKIAAGIAESKKIDLHLPLHIYPEVSVEKK